MKISHKIYGVIISICLLSSVFIYGDENAHEIPHKQFQPNKRHMHEKKEQKKEPDVKKSVAGAARIHKKQEEKTGVAKNTLTKKLPKKTIMQKKQPVQRHTTKVARHNKKGTEVKKESIFQKTWGKIKAFFSSKKTA